MIDAKEAVRIARSYFTELFSDQVLSNIQLEEVERTDDGKHWRVTIGYDRGVDTNQLRTILGETPRYYKVVTIDAISGQAESVKIRTT